MHVVLLTIIGSLILSFAVSPPMATRATVHVENEQAKDGVRRIRVAELIRLLKDNKAILVDVRSERAYRAGHIKGAIPIPVDEIENRISELPKDKLIATYCAWPAEQTSAGAVQIMNDKGIKEAAAVLGGYDALLKAGFEEVTGN